MPVPVVICERKLDNGLRCDRIRNTPCSPTCHLTSPEFMRDVYRQQLARDYDR
jgi:hypothetical protein